MKQNLYTILMQLKIWKRYFNQIHSKIQESNGWEVYSWKNSVQTRISF